MSVFASTFIPMPKDIDSSRFGLNECFIACFAPNTTHKIMPSETLTIKNQVVLFRGFIDTTILYPILEYLKGADVTINYGPTGRSDGKFGSDEIDLDANFSKFAKLNKISMTNKPKYNSEWTVNLWNFSSKENIFEISNAMDPQVLSGKQLKDVLGEKFYKVVCEDLMSSFGSFQYQMGLNIDPNPWRYGFSADIEDNESGLFFALRENIDEFADYGNVILELTIPDDAKVSVGKFEMKADRIIVLGAEKKEMKQKNSNTSYLRFFI